MSGTLFAPAEYHGGELGAAGYGTAAIGTHQTSSLTGGVVANPSNYSSGCMSGGRRRKRGSKRGCKTKRRGYGRRSMSRSRRCRRGRYSRGGGHKHTHI